MRPLMGFIPGTAGLGWSGSCGPELLVPLCHQVREGTALFSGIAVEKGPLEQGYWARFAVKEIYQGLPPGTTEGIVYPGIWSGFEVGESYLVTAAPWIDFGPNPWTWLD